MKAAVPFDSSLERLIGLLEAHNPNLYALLQATTEDQFVAAVEGALDFVIVTIEGGSKQYAKLGERGLSKLLADLLSAAGFRAAAERDVNGHVDVVVEHAFGGRWKYLCECKIHDGFEYHIRGCEQLLRYCTGREKRGLVLDFFTTAGMLTKLSELQRRIDQERRLGQTAASLCHTIKGAFVTSHAHGNGSIVELLHAGCALVAVSAASGDSSPKPARKKKLAPK